MNNESSNAKWKRKWESKSKKYLERKLCTQNQLDDWWYEFRLVRSQMAKSDRASYGEQVMALLTYQAVRNCTVDLEELEMDWMEKEFIKPDNYNTFIKQDHLPKPQDTFQIKVEGRKCPFCGSHNTGSWAFQKRSSDEPTSYKHACRDCSKSWDTRT